MKLTSSNEVLAENKVLILYILDKIGEPTTDNELLKLVLSITDMNYFYFQQFMLDLLSSNYVSKYEKDNHSFYLLTDEGKKALELTINIVPGILKLRVDTNIKPCQNDIKNELSIVADFEPEDTNNFFVDCKIIENNKTIFSVRILAGSREQAKFICDNWKENATSLYPNLLNILTKTKT